MLSSGRISDRNRPEQQKYLKWYTEEKKKGMATVSGSSSLSLANFLGVICNYVYTSEEIYRDLNEANDVVARGDREA